MTYDLIEPLIFAYFFGGVLWFILGGVFKAREDSDMTDRQFARHLLATFVWPLDLLWHIVRHLLPATGRGVGWVLKNAFKPEVKDV